MIMHYCRKKFRQSDMTKIDYIHIFLSNLIETYFNCKEVNHLTFPCNDSSIFLTDAVLWIAQVSFCDILLLFVVDNSDYEI